MLSIRSNAPGRSREPADLPRVCDHDRVYDLLHDSTPQLLETAPARAAFGLPHNYFFRSSKKKTSFVGSGRGEERRASPVLLHVARVWTPENQTVGFVPTVLWLKSRMTRDSQVHCEDNRTRPKDDPSLLKAPDWTAIVEFLRTLLNLPPLVAAVEEPPAPPPAPRPPAKVKPINKGQTREGTLKRTDGGGWTAVFIDAAREGQVRDPKKLLGSATDGCRATFFIEEANKHQFTARLEKLS